MNTTIISYKYFFIHRIKNIHYKFITKTIHCHRKFLPGSILHYIILTFNTLTFFHQSIDLSILGINKQDDNQFIILFM